MWVASQVAMYGANDAPTIADITVVRRGDVRRAKLYYLRQRSGKSARIKEKLPQRKVAAE